MKTVTLSHTDFKVSIFCLGTMYFGTKTDESTSFAILDQYVEAGGRFLDSANKYASWVPGFVGGESETLLGKWMKARGNRKDLFITSKLGFPMPGVEKGLRASQIEAECEKSLKRLGIETIDLYYAHSDDRQTPMEESLEAFDRLVKAGKVRLLGASNFLAWRFEQARLTSQIHEWAAYSCVQQRYSYLRPKNGTPLDNPNQIVANSDLLEYCAYHNLTMLAYSPLLGGAYSRSDKPLPAAYLSQDSEERMRVLHAMAAEKGCTPNQLVLAWLVHSRPLIIPLVTGSSCAQMQENLGALNISLSDEEMTRLNEAHA